jgi:hypothetical protein
MLPKKWGPSKRRPLKNSEMRTRRRRPRAIALHQALIQALVQFSQLATGKGEKMRPSTLREDMT